MNTHVLHHSTVRTQLFKKLKHFTLDTLIAVGEWGEHTHVELFTLSNSKWQIREDYPFSKDISALGCEIQVANIRKKANSAKMNQLNQ